MFDIKDICEYKLFSTLHSLSVDFMEIALIDRSEGFINETHVHDWFDISYIMKGSLKYQIEDRVYTVSEGDVVVIGPHMKHKETCDEDAEFQVLFVCMDFVKDGKSFNIMEHLSFKEVTEAYGLKGIQSVFSSILSEVTYREPGYLMKVNAQIYNLLVALYRQKHVVENEGDAILETHMLRKRTIVDNILKYIEENYGQKISLSAISKTFYLSPPYISTLFKNCTGYTLIEYLNRIRIKEAKELMAGGETDINEISLQVGFSIIHYFYKVFKQLEDKTPVQFLSNYNVLHKQ